MAFSSWNYNYIQIIPFKSEKFQKIYSLEEKRARRPLLEDANF